MFRLNFDKFRGRAHLTPAQTCRGKSFRGMWKKAGNILYYCFSFYFHRKNPHRNKMSMKKFIFNFFCVHLLAFWWKKKRGASPCHGPVYVFRFGYSSSYQCYFFKGNNRIHYAYKHVWGESICRNIFKFRMIISWGFQRTTSLTHLYWYQGVMSESKKLRKWNLWYTERWQL